MAEEPKDIGRIFREEGHLLDQAMMRGAWEALRVHKESGHPLAIWRDGRVVWVSPDEFERGLREAAAR